MVGEEWDVAGVMLWHAAGDLDAQAVEGGYDVLCNMRSIGHTSCFSLSLSLTHRVRHISEDATQGVVFLSFLHITEHTHRRRCRRHP